MWFADVDLKNHSSFKAEWFLFFYLLKIITSIIKANTTIVSVTKPNKSRYIISNKTASIICTTSILTTDVVD